MDDVVTFAETMIRLLSPHYWMLEHTNSFDVNVIEDTMEGSNFEQNISIHNLLNSNKLSAILKKKKL